MLNKLRAVEDRYEELCAKSERPDFYNDPKLAAKLLREKNDLEPIVESFRDYRRAEQEMLDAFVEYMNEKAFCYNFFIYADAVFAISFFVPT